MVVGVFTSVDRGDARYRTDVYLCAGETMSAWTTERPTKAGWYWWRYTKGSTEHIMKVYPTLAVEWLNGEADHVDEIDGEWQPVVLPQD